MTAYDAIEAAAAAVRSRIMSHAVELGDVKGVLDRDEDPAILADNAIGLPIACVIPLGDRPDKITFSMGSADWLHDFSINIVPYYRFSTDNKNPFADLPTVRRYSFGYVELFRRPNDHVSPGCNAKGADIDIGYYMENDYVLYRADIMLRCTMYESG